MSCEDDGNVFADFSGIVTPMSENPYNTLIDACANDPVRFVNGFDEMFY